MNLIRTLQLMAVLLLVLVGCVDYISPKNEQSPDTRINYAKVLNTWANGLHKGIQHEYQVIEVRKPNSTKKRDLLVFTVMVYYYVDTDPFIEYHAVVIDSRGKVVLSENITPPEDGNPESEESTENPLKLQA